MPAATHLQRTEHPPVVSLAAVGSELSHTQTLADGLNAEFRGQILASERPRQHLADLKRFEDELVYHNEVSVSRYLPYTLHPTPYTLQPEP